MNHLFCLLPCCTHLTPSSQLKHSLHLLTYRQRTEKMQRSLITQHFEAEKERMQEENVQLAATIRVKEKVRGRSACRALHSRCVPIGPA